MKKNLYGRMFRNKCFIRVFLSLAIFTLALALFAICWQSFIDSRASIAVTYIDTRDRFVNAKQVWYVFINPGETKFRAYPMEREDEKSKTFKCSIPISEIKHGFIGHVLASKKYLGEEPFTFELVPYVSSITAIQRI